MHQRLTLGAVDLCSPTAVFSDAFIATAVIFCGLAAPPRPFPVVPIESPAFLMFTVG